MRLKIAKASNRFFKRRRSTVKRRL